ncbi:hypothetical protein ABZ816_28505 [Actinosynnema sp. NPDC047251]|uniref:hypothetical protein n=1 Tax=Saccharothrix espanaensis TaxID=103731 RepID=UPI00059BC42B|nr:hypothetical protein [Saccharothrix espanaensis]
MTALAAAISSSGLLFGSVRRVLSLIFRRPSKNSVVIRFNDDYLSVDMDENFRQRVVERALVAGLSEDEAQRLARAVLAQLPGRGTSGPTSVDVGEVKDAK